jgi:hypothetical protein
MKPPLAQRAPVSPCLAALTRDRLPSVRSRPEAHTPSQLPPKRIVCPPWPATPQGHGGRPVAAVLPFGVDRVARRRSATLCPAASADRPADLRADLPVGASSLQGPSRTRADIADRGEGKGGLPPTGPLLHISAQPIRWRALGVSRLTADPAHNVLWSAGQAQAGLAEIPASNPASSNTASSLSGVEGTTASALSLSNQLRLARPATASTARAGLIEQSTRPLGNGFSIRLSSTRPAGYVPAGITQGEEI